MSSDVDYPGGEPPRDVVLTDGDETIVASVSSRDDEYDHDNEAETAQIEQAIDDLADAAQDDAQDDAAEAGEDESVEVGTSRRDRDRREIEAVESS